MPATATDLTYATDADLLAEATAFERLWAHRRDVLRRRARSGRWGYDATRRADRANVYHWATAAVLQRDAAALAFGHTYLREGVRRRLMREMSKTPAEAMLTARC